MKKINASLAMIILFSEIGLAQPDSASSRIKIFMDCQSTWCDITYIKSELPIIDFMLNRLEADVHVLITSLETGSGGEQYQLILFGQNSFGGTKDTIRFNLKPNYTELEQREALLKFLNIGLVPYFIKKGYIDRVSININKDSTSNKQQQENIQKKKWNYWIFNIGARGNINEDQTYKNYYGSGNFSVSRTTEKLKISFYTYSGLSMSSITYKTNSGDTTLKNLNKYSSIYHLLVKSISNHWSYGYIMSYSNNTFMNNKSSLYASPGIEYNIFSYSDVNNKSLTIFYGPEIRNKVYYDTTIYDKMREILPGHNLNVNLSLNQKWGTTELGFNYRDFFSKRKFNNFSIATSLNVRATGNLTFNFRSSLSFVNDQMYLEKGNASEQEILTRRKQLLTNYTFYTTFGINYRFGSSYNNVINSRFEGANGDN